MFTNVQQLRAHLLERLQKGEHLILYGPRGSGKSRLVLQLRVGLGKANIPCAIASSTTCLNDITRTLAMAYPGAETGARTRRGARSRLWVAADQRRGVLLLDHVSAMSTAMLGFLRRLRGGVAGILMVVDLDVERDRRHIRALRVGMLSVHMPRTPARTLLRLLRSRCKQVRVGLDRDTQTKLMRVARGRPGWILQCASLLAQGRYRREGRLLLSVLCTDTEFALREGNLRWATAKESAESSTARSAS